MGVDLTIEKLKMLFLLEASSVGAKRIVGALFVIYGVVSFVCIGHYFDALFSWFPWSGWLFNVLICFIVLMAFKILADLYAFEPVDGPTRLSPW